MDSGDIIPHVGEFLKPEATPVIVSGLACDHPKTIEEVQSMRLISEELGDVKAKEKFNEADCGIIEEPGVGGFVTYREEKENGDTVIGVSETQGGYTDYWMVIPKEPNHIGKMQPYKKGWLKL